MYRRTHSPYSLAGNFPAVETDSLFGLETFSTGEGLFVSVRQTGCRTATVWNCALADRHTDSMDNIRIAFIRTKVGRELRLLYI